MKSPALRILVLAVLFLALVAALIATAALWPAPAPSQPSTTPDQEAPRPAPPGAAHSPAPSSWLPEPSTTFPIRRLDYEHFTVGYDEAAKSPAWVVYHLAGPITVHGHAERPMTFQTDFRTAAHVAHRDYSGSGFDRGHLCPSYAMWSRHGDKAMRETFITTNIIPQRHGLNAGEWESLEAAIAGRDGHGDGWAAIPGGVWVINGPAYDHRPATRTLRNGTWIPTACWSVVMRQHAGDWQLKAFIMPNEEQVAGPYTHFQVTLDQVVKLSGVDVLAGLEEEHRAKLMLQRDTARWP